MLFFNHSLLLHGDYWHTNIDHRHVIYTPFVGTDGVNIDPFFDSMVLLLLVPHVGLGYQLEYGINDKIEFNFGAALTFPDTVLITKYTDVSSISTWLISIFPPGLMLDFSLQFAVKNTEKLFSSQKLLFNLDYLTAGNGMAGLQYSFLLGTNKNEAVYNIILSMGLNYKFGVVSIMTNGIGAFQVSTGIEWNRSKARRNKLIYTWGFNFRYDFDLVPYDRNFNYYTSKNYQQIYPTIIIYQGKLAVSFNFKLGTLNTNKQYSPIKNPAEDAN